MLCFVEKIALMGLKLLALVGDMDMGLFLNIYVYIFRERYLLLFIYSHDLFVYTNDLLLFYFIHSTYVFFKYTSSYHKWARLGRHSLSSFLISESPRFESLIRWAVRIVMSSHEQPGSPLSLLK